ESAALSCQECGNSIQLSLGLGCERTSPWGIAPWGENPWGGGDDLHYSRALARCVESSVRSHRGDTADALIMEGGLAEGRALVTDDGALTEESHQLGGRTQSVDEFLRGCGHTSA